MKRPAMQRPARPAVKSPAAHRRASPPASSFVVSGVAGLVLQVAWFRMLAQSLGGNLAATTAVLTAFMAGLSLGAAGASRVSPRLQRPLAAYAWLEVGVAAAAAATVPLLRFLDVAYRALALPLEGHEAALTAVKLVLAALVIGGVAIPCERGLAGHSDADVALHCASAVLETLFPAVANTIGLHVHNGVRVCNIAACKGQP